MRCGDERDRRIPRKWRYRQYRPVERERGMMEQRDWESEEEEEEEEEGGPNQNQMQAESPVLFPTQTSWSLLAYPSK